MSTLTTALAENGVKAVEIETIKNGVVFTGYQLDNGTDIKPVIYYSPKETVESFVDRALEATAMVTPSLDTENIISYERLLTNTYLCLQRQSREDIVKKKYLDLELYVRLGINLFDDESKGSVKITSQILDSVGLSEDELFEAARRNSIEKATICSMSEVLGDLGFLDELIENPPFYVATYDDRAHGAGIMALTEVLHDFCKDKGYTRIYIIPSSTEEILLLPIENIDPEDLVSMVNDVNNNTVDPMLQLNPTVYSFDNTTQRVIIASSIREEAK